MSRYPRAGFQVRSLHLSLFRCVSLCTKANHLIAYALKTFRNLMNSRVFGERQPYQQLWKLLRTQLEQLVRTAQQYPSYLDPGGSRFQMEMAAMILEVCKPCARSLQRHVGRALAS
ncbi:hypothetical protein KCU93_g106, partial [Aureobasidium melanogenum]